MKRRFLLLCLGMLFFVGCQSMGEGEKIKEEDIGWMNEITSVVTDNKIAEDDKNTMSQESESQNDISKEEDEEMGRIGMNIKLVTTKNMPIAEEALVYKGIPMKYGVVMSNDSDFPVDYTFFILVNGELQPFMLEGESETKSSTNTRLKVREEKIVYFSFTPISAPYGERSVISFVGFVANAEPSISSSSPSSAMSNSMTCDDTMMLTAENASCQIKQNREENVMGSPVEKLYSDSMGGATNVCLADGEMNKNNFSKIKTDDLKLNHTIRMYAASRGEGKVRTFLWCEGELVPAFDGKMYVDIPMEKDVLYYIPIEQSVFGQRKSQRSCLISIYYMSGIEEMIRGGEDGFLNYSFGQLHIIS